MAVLARGDLHVLGNTNLHTIKRCNVPRRTMDPGQRRCRLGKSHGAVARRVVNTCICRHNRPVCDRRNEDQDLGLAPSQTRITPPHPLSCTKSSCPSIPARDLDAGFVPRCGAAVLPHRTAGVCNLVSNAFGQLSRLLSQPSSDGTASQTSLASRRRYCVLERTCAEYLVHCTSLSSGLGWKPAEARRPASLP